MITRSSTSASTSCITWLDSSTQRPCAAQLAQPVAQVPRRHHVEAVRRLVEQEMLRVVDERARERDLRALALREALRLAVRDRAELEPLDQRVDARRERALRRGRAGGRSTRCSRAPVSCVVEPRAVRQHAEHAARRERGRREIDAADARRAGIGREHRREDPQARRLAGAVRPEQARDPAVRGREADAVERADRAEAAC